MGLIELGIFPHVKRGFHCDDQSIAYKFTGDTIPTSLVLVTIFVPFFLVWMSEAIFYKPTSIKASRLRKSAHQSYLFFREYFVGMILHIFIMDALKVCFLFPPANMYRRLFNLSIFIISYIGNCWRITTTLFRHMSTRCSYWLLWKFIHYRIHMHEYNWKKLFRARCFQIISVWSFFDYFFPSCLYDMVTYIFF